MLMKHSLQLCLVVAMLLISGAPVQAETPSLSKLGGLAEKYVAALNKYLAADNSGSWIPFVSSDKEKAGNEVRGYLDEALVVLMDDSLVRLKNDVKKLQAENRALEEKNTLLWLDKSAAPTSSKFYEIWKTTTSDIDDKISDNKRKINRNNNLVEQNMEKIQRGLESGGIVLTRGQFDGIFLTVSGEDQLESMVVLKNLYALSDATKALMGESNNLTVSKKYYGIFLLATGAHQYQLQNNLKAIDDDYIPRITDLQAQNRRLMNETREKARTNPQYQSNLNAQETTDLVASKFKDLLAAQRGIIKERISALTNIIQYTENAYKTVSLASNISDIMDRCVSDLQDLLAMPVLPPMDVENDLEQKFLEISDMLASKE
ncbi:MAG: hypothetical protein LBO05_05620 [Deltaproteobacteria bacterium]|nr:hypothetical protein [Deltaproteobacteria bacterium]